MTSRPSPVSVASSPSSVLGWTGPWLGVGSLWLWTATGSAWTLALGAAGFVASVVWGREGAGRTRAFGIALVLAGILVGFWGERQIGQINGDWDGYWTSRVLEVGDLLNEELDRRQVSGEAASAELLDLWLDAGQLDAATVSEIRTRHRSQAVALYDPTGRLVAWDGDHRGKVPESVQRGESRWSYRDLPLFGYLYMTSVGPDGSAAMAAYLLRAALPEGLGADMGDLASRFFSETGERIRITEEDPTFAEAFWDLDLDDDRLLSVVLERPLQEERATTERARWAFLVALIAAGAWLLLVVGGRLGRREATAAALALVAGAAWAPVSGLGPAGLFESGGFTLPGPIPLSAGRLALLTIAAFAVVAVRPRLPFEVPAWVGGLLAGAAFPLLLLWTGAGVRGELLAFGRPEWVSYTVSCAGLLSLAAGFCMVHTRAGEGSRAMTGVAAGLAVLLSSILAFWVTREGTSLVAGTALWAVPVALGALGVTAWVGWQRSLLRWALAILLGSSAAIPVAWGQRVESRIVVGSERLLSLAAVEDPEMEDRLFEFARIADSLDVAGAADVSILYDGWRLSGLAELGHPVWLQIEERSGAPGEGLRVGVGDSEPQPYQELLAQGRRAGGVRLVQLNEDDARYIVTAPLDRERMLVAVAPPFPESSGVAALGPLLRSADDVEAEALAVIRLPDDTTPGPAAVEILPTETGWRADIDLAFTNGPVYRAQYAIDLPSVPLIIARGTLLMALTLSVFLALWLLGRLVLGGAGDEERPFTGWGVSFRARVTLALFGFFALANALFVTVAYRTLAQAEQRSAQVLAERVVEDAAGWYRAMGGQMERLATQVGAELLEYRDGELREGSVEELVELGLYEGWTPYAVQRTLDGFDVVEELIETSVGRWEYVTAYRRLPDGDVLAAQVPLQAGTSALQTTDLIELLGFVILLGVALSLALAMITGRALTRPILALQIASESVGSGDLGMRLPAHRTDEFGAVFRAFNRMVGRVRRARRQLVRTSRRTQLIMDEAAVGMVALDPAGRVTLVNPRAEELLDTEVYVGRHLPAEGPMGEALTVWLGDYLQGNADEANSDFQVGERRVRVRARRLGTFGTRRGVVVALDDVTDELRAERVIAWGEMARQVAHEVKNPLTPIKLSIQHVRRAWDDERPDFEEILVKNADAMLNEIDRLAEIAQSFSRFGAPGGEQVAPLAAVALDEVVGEVMALYGGSAARVHFEQEIERGLPPVVARTAELKEVLVNLLENARLAGEDGTRVRIVGRRLDDERVSLAVEDNGSGIPEDVLPRIFEPQFSTRSKGTGLGLAIVQRVVRAWGGSVEVTSELGQGTTVLVTLRIWSESDAVGAEGGSPFGDAGERSSSEVVEGADVGDEPQSS